MDASLQKTVHITERHSLELRMEGVNVLNHATFLVGQTRTSTRNTFGVIGSTFYTVAPSMQFAPVLTGSNAWPPQDPLQHLRNLEHRPIVLRRALAR